MNQGLCVEFPIDPKQVFIHSATEPSSTGPLKFTFDYVFPPGSEQALVYEAAAKPTVESVLEGFNGTVFAYGQTGSGKTFTMSGADLDDERLKGIIPRMIKTVFSAISSASEHLEFTVKVGFCEIYMEKIKDLLNSAKNNLKVHEDKSRGVFIADLTEEYVSTEVEVANLMKFGTQNREVGATLMNEGSSRSHSLFIMTITQNNTMDYSAKTGKLYLVDLAGSEKVGKTGAEGKRLDEAKTINKSLSSLGKVINALTDGKSIHVPYRDSKLTRVLQDSLGGNSKTALIITCSPSSYNEAETISTLRFGTRAKAIKNKPKINKEFTVAELKLLLSKGEAELRKKERRIFLLESTIVEAGGKLPSEETAEVLDDIDGPRGEVLPPPELEEMHQELEETRLKLSEQTETVEQISVQLVRVSEKERELLQQREKMQREMNNLLNTIHDLEEKNQDAEEKSTKLALMQTGYQAQINTLMSQNAKMELKLTEEDAEIDRLREQLAVKDEEIKELKLKLEAWETVIAQLASLNCDSSALASLISPLQNHNWNRILSLHQLYVQEQQKVSRLTEELNHTKAQLEETLQDKVTNVHEIMVKIRAETDTELLNISTAMQHERSVERAVYQKREEELKTENSKLLQELEFEQINYTNLENAMAEGERQLKKKMNSLERNLEQVTLMYHKLSNQKIDVQSYEKKLMRKNEKIERLEQELKILKQASGSGIESSDGDQGLRTLGRIGFGGNKIKKTIKGGKAQKIRVMGMFSPFSTFSKPESQAQNSKPLEENSLEETP